jgi:rifampin ADP-ribosylating transferase
MQFNPNNPIVKLCILGMQLEASGETGEAGQVFLRGWNEATNDFEKYLAAWFVARVQQDVHEKLKWLERASDFAIKINDPNVRTAFPSIYAALSKCYQELGDHESARKFAALSASFQKDPSDPGPFYHGTKADLRPGDLLTAGKSSNYKDGFIMNHIYFTALVDGAGLAAALAKGEGSERVYQVEPTGNYENDPNVTDKKFPGNPTRSYRSQSPLKILSEVKEWNRISPEEIQKWKAKLAENKGDIIN